MEKIRDSKAPQVLKIDHDDAISLSGDSEVDSDEELSPLRGDSDTEHIRVVRAENHLKEDDRNCKILPSGSALPFLLYRCFALFFIIIICCLKCKGTLVTKLMMSNYLSVFRPVCLLTFCTYF